MSNINLNLDEVNELQFSLSIKGSVNEQETKSPSIRFSIVESSTNFAFSFPATKIENDMVNISIPEMKNVFKENVEYKGKLEVFVGSRYFNPTTVNIAFKKSLQVEAKIVDTSTALKKVNVLTEEFTDIESIIKPAPTVRTPKVQVDQKILQKAVFSGVKPSPTPIVRKPVGVKSVSEEVVTENEDVEHDSDDPFEVYKKKLKSIIAEAVKEI